MRVLIFALEMCVLIFVVEIRVLKQYPKSVRGNLAWDVCVEIALGMCVLKLYLKCARSNRT